MQGHTATINTLAWSPDGKMIASGSDDKSVRIWDATTGKQLYGIWTTAFAVLAVAWSPDSKLLAISDQVLRRHYPGVNKLIIWDVKKRIWSAQLDGHLDALLAVAWSPDGTMMAGASADNKVYVWAVKNHKPQQVYKEHTAPVTSVAWSPDGTEIASASADKTVRVWSATNTTTRLRLDVRALISRVAWSPDGNEIASATDNVVHFWDAHSGQPLFDVQDHPGAVTDITWSADSKFLASASLDGTVLIWSQSQTGN
jgi:Tol biopolymer transport system component